MGRVLAMSDYAHSKKKVTEITHNLIHHLKDRGEDFDTVLGILLCAKTDAQKKELLTWLEVHPDEDHDEILGYACWKYLGFCFSAYTPPEE